MTRTELIRRLRAYAKFRDLRFQVEENRGKGSHYRVTAGNKRTTIPHNLHPNIVRAILKQLDIDPAEL